jgi:hypothetical protein
MKITRFIVKALPPLVILGLVASFAFFGCDPTSVATGSTQQTLSENCVMVAKLQCPFACSQIDTTSICHGDFGAVLNTQCDAAATGNCLTDCGSTCAIQCQANAQADCGSSCNSQCANNCRALCAGAVHPTDCENQCDAQCKDACNAQCRTHTEGSCQSKCNATCGATCNVEAKVACAMRATVDAQAKCTANVAAKCMGDCTSDFTLRCVQGADEDAGLPSEAAPPLPPPSPAHPRLRPLGARAP